MEPWQRQTPLFRLKALVFETPYYAALGLLFLSNLADGLLSALRRTA